MWGGANGSRRRGSFGVICMAKMNVQARNCEVGTDLREHFEEKLEHLERMWPKAEEALVRVSHERGRYAAEITLLSGGMTTRGEERAATLRQAFDNALEKLEGQLRRYKTKVQAQQRRHDNRDDVAGTVGRAMRAASPDLSPDGISPSASATYMSTQGTVMTAEAAENDEREHEEDGDDVVRVKRFALKPMSAQEASLQMGLLGHSFFVFRDAKSDQISVVYRRRDGGYGLIEPVSD